MEGEIASLNWKACDTCEWHRLEGGCNLANITLVLDPMNECIRCDEYIFDDAKEG